MKDFRFVRTRERRTPIAPVRNTRRVERTLKLITLLSDWNSIREIAEHLQIHPKSVNRYLNMLVDLGFEVQWSWKGRYNYYRIGNAKEYFRLE